VRLVKYTVGQTVFSLATTLLDAALYRGPDLARLYHGRWSLEEYYKISKAMLVVEQFRGRSERLVRQELYALFTLAALSRLFANHSEECLPGGPGRARSAGRAGQLPPYAAHSRAPSGRAVPGASQAGGRCAAADSGRDRGQPPAAAFWPLLPAPFAQARDEVEEPQGSRNGKSSYSLTPPKIGPEPEF